MVVSIFFKIAIITNFSLNLVSGENCSRQFDEGKSTKKSFKNLRHGPQKTVSKDLKQRRRRRLGKRRLKNELVFLLQISRMAECIQPA